MVPRGELVEHVLDAVPAALFAGLVAIAVTVVIERLGGKVGGLVGTVPSTIVPAALGIFWQSPDVDGFRQAMDATPSAMLLNAGFLWLWRSLPPRLPARRLPFRLVLMTATSLLLWLCGAAALVLANEAWRGADLPSAALGLASLALLVALGIVATSRSTPAPAGRKRVGPFALVARGAMAATSIFVAVTVAGHGGSVAAGVASVFPAIFLTTMVALWVAQGEAVQSGAVGPMMLGSTSVAAFALAARWLLPWLGPAPGAAVSWIAAVLLTTLPAWGWLQTRRHRA